MRKGHIIKIPEDFVDAIMSGDKTFEVQYNDRGYQKGDYIKFHVSEGRKNTYEPIEDKQYMITYVLSGWHIEPNYVVFGIREVVDECLSCS